MNNNHLIGFETWQPDDIRLLLDKARHFKNGEDDVGHRFVPAKELAGKHWVMLFEKASTRTRISFEIGLQKLGMHAIFNDFQQGSMVARESAGDLAKNLSCWSDGIIVRANSHEILCELAAQSQVPVINALCDRYHPCQALADFQTLAELGLLNDSSHLVYVGDGNNVCHSLMQLACFFSVQLTVVTPEGFGPDWSVLDFCDSLGLNKTVTITHSLQDVGAADVVYTDTWISMGSGKDSESIEASFRDYQVDDALMTHLKAKHFMHCQPLTRGVEVTSSVADGRASVIYQQATNRLWTQMAVLDALSGPSTISKEHV